jgi:RND superfamily putative drug exporter
MNITSRSNGKTSSRKDTNVFSFLSPERIARKSARHPWITAGLWVLLVVAAFTGAGMQKTDSTAPENKNFESQRADDILTAARGEEPASENVIVISETAKVDSQEFRAYVTGLTNEIRGLDGVASAEGYYDTGDKSLVSADGHKTVIAVTLSGDADEAGETVTPLYEAVTAANGRDGYRVLTVGDGSFSKELTEAFMKDLERSEVIGLPVALIVLVVIFGAAVAAGLPLLLSFLAIFIAVGITGVASNFVPMGDVVMNMIIMIGLAVGIDYSLFIVERFREERARGLDKVDAIVLAGATASRAVLFSGITVIIALAGLLIVPSTTFHGLALGAIAAVVGAVLAALTLLPAVLSLLGDKVNALHLPGRGSVRAEHSEHGFWARVTGAVMAHPMIAIAASVTLLVAAALPVVTMRIGSPGVSELPRTLQAVQGFEVLDADFGAGRLAPVEVVLQGDANSREVQAGIERLEASLAGDSRFGGVLDLVTTPDGRTGVFHIYVNGDSIGSDAQAAVRELREKQVPAAFAGADVTVLVGGGTARNVDFVDSMTRYLPIVIAFVLTLSLILLTLVFRSLVIPVKAIVMNLLSVGAAYGLIVAVFQHGIGADILGFQQVDTVVAWLPAFLFAVLFGLSMDYHVFLLSRIQERFLQTGDNRGSVAYGLQSTGHIITGAAAIMVAVFAAFSLAEIVELQQMGFGLAVAVLVDATIIRSVLVPASMEMLGAWNWYMPSWLSWLPRINVEGARVRIPAPAPQIAPEGLLAD